MIDHDKTNNILNITLAQLNPLVGDITNNVAAMVKAAQQARDTLNADVIIFSELAVCGYNSEDLLLRPEFISKIEQAIQSLIQVKNIILIFGLPVLSPDNILTNRAQVFLNNQLLCDYIKSHLPNYGVFDEQRYFAPGHEPGLFKVRNITCGIGLCEDFWTSSYIETLKNKGASLIFNLNASPFDIQKSNLRMQHMSAQCQSNQISMIYVNQVGGQDDLLFDGGSFALNNTGQMIHQSPFFEESLQNVTYDLTQHQFIEKPITHSFHLESMLYKALVLSIRDYINKNNFKGVILGLSGGIDSALVLSLAVDALGKDRVEAVMMPYHYTAPMSLEDAEQEANLLGVKYSVLPIESVYNALNDTLSSSFVGLEQDVTEENLQARIRGILLMAMANKKQYMVLNTGNKSELSIGYTTLYGDMVGGFNVLKDVSKTLVYQLAKWRNQTQEIIPKRVISRPPSAELAPNQIDQNSLPPYHELDKILSLYIEKNQSIQQIIAFGFEKEWVEKIITWIHANEYKRRQSVIGPKISTLAFDRERRYPITTPKTVTL